MAYFLRKTKRKNGDIYFQVYDSYYSMDQKKNKNKFVETLDLLSKLRKDGESDEDCEKRLREKVSGMESERSGKDAKQIGEYMQKRTSLPLLGKRLTDTFFDPKKRRDRKSR